MRRAKLYYLRGRVGKRARVAERAWSGEVEEAIMPEEAVAATEVAPDEVEFEEPPEEAEPVEYQAPEKEQIDEGAAVVPSDSEGAQEATEAEMKAAEEAAETEPESSANGDAELWRGHGRRVRKVLIFRVEAAFTEPGYAAGSSPRGDQLS